jgi:hypothetical protein
MDSMKSEHLENANTKIRPASGWGLSHGNFFLTRFIDHEETWKYTNGSGWF